jgi:hypothetical protein
MDAFEARIVHASARARDYGPSVKRFIVGGVGGGLPQCFIVAASATSAEAYFRRLHGFAKGDLLERVLVNVTELGD